MASLAGVQDKVLLARVDEGWAQCLYGYASTHILKSVSRPHLDMIFNEENAFASGSCARRIRSPDISEARREGEHPTNRWSRRRGPGP